MPVRHIPFGPPVNESERKAIELLKSKLQSHGDDWVMLSNLHHHSHAARLSDEIDLVLIGPRGVIVVEIKHWDLGYIKSNAIKAEAEAERINDKAKRIAGKLRQGGRDSGFVSARMLLTGGGTGVIGGQRQLIRGVPTFGLSEWKELIETVGPAIFTQQQMEDAARRIEPLSKPALTGQLRQFGGLINLEKVSPPTEAFHRVYRGQHPSRRDKVVLHLFDLSASSEKQPELLARREFDVIQQWQKSPFVPSLLDSFQEAEQYPGELFYFSLVDSDAPTLLQRSEGKGWSRDDRIRYAQDALRALHGFHKPDDSRLPELVHRNITPETLRVRHNGKPLFTGFSVSRIADAQTISPADAQGASNEWAAPEVRRGGLAAADARSDVYSLCKSLRILFADDTAADRETRELLAMGCEEDAQKRESPWELASALESHSSPGAKSGVPELPAAEFWDEGTIVPFQSTRYKIVSRLGKGGIGQTFKVVELDAKSDELFGTYVAKIIQHETDAVPALRAYRKVRAYTVHRNLSALHEIAPTWQGDRFAALLKWVEGVPLHDLKGVLELHREELAEPSFEALVLRWAKDLCEALWQLHQVRLVHGDVSPRNIIVEGGNVVLTDYDTVADQGGVPRTHHAWYASEAVEARIAITASDDLFALAASFFHVMFDREPFLFGATRRKNQGLNWEMIEATNMPQLRAFLDRATHPNPQRRFLDAREALSSLAAGLTDAPSPVPPSPPLTTLSAQVVDRLSNLLSAYPGSRFGNAETRGLDSDFAAQTYVETGLDQSLKRDVQAANVDLIVLFGNAGDGKTAFLQNLAQEVGGDLIPSRQRLCERRLDGGRLFKVNLDGSAAYQNQSANQILEAFFKPFHTLAPTRNSTHAIAINSGKMLEWLDERDDDTPFTEQLRDSLFGSKAPPNPRLRLIDLNHRSLVGGINEGQIGTQFLDALLDRFLGTQIKPDPWAACASCSAQHRCSARASVLALRDAQHGSRLRRRLADALQACHLRGEIHITARELRAALVFIFFGVNDCQELHENPELTPAPYWDRVFSAEGPASAQRQGELLKELARFDPALDANPIIDRQLLAQHAVASTGTAERLATARRRAYFEWSETDFAQLQLPSDALPLHGAQHLDRFRRVPLMSEQEQQTLCRELCQGIARLEDLPELAHTRSSEGLPLRLTPRTPTDSAFWVLKPWTRFTLTGPLPPATQGLEVLHTHLMLTYRYADGSEEHLPIGLELFHLLLELKDGMQLSGIGQEGVFAHLEIFVQRLAQEDSRELWGWHPEADEAVMRLRVSLQDGRQTLIRETAPDLIGERA